MNLRLKAIGILILGILIVIAGIGFAVILTFLINAYPNAVLVMMVIGICYSIYRGILANLRNTEHRDTCKKQECLHPAHDKEYYDAW